MCGDESRVWLLIQKKGTGFRVTNNKSPRRRGGQHARCPDQILMPSRTHKKDIKRQSESHMQSPDRRRHTNNDNYIRTPGRGSRGEAGTAVEINGKTMLLSLPGLDGGCLCRGLDCLMMVVVMMILNSGTDAATETKSSASDDRRAGEVVHVAIACVRLTNVSAQAERGECR